MTAGLLIGWIAVGTLLIHRDDALIKWAARTALV